MTNRSSFELVNTGQRYYFVVGAWLSNFCHGLKKEEKIMVAGYKETRLTFFLEAYHSTLICFSFYKALVINITVEIFFHFFGFKQYCYYFINAA